MSIQTAAVEYQTVVVGSACRVKELLERLQVAAIIDRALRFQPEVATPDGALAQVLIVNRMSMDPQPLYQLASWAAERGIDRRFDLQAEWLDDDRLGALLEALADHQVTLWSALLGQAAQQFALDMEQLHADTTSVYFEGAYEDDHGRPKGGGERVPRRVRGYNKDGKRQKLQLVLSLITSHPLPLWFRPWDGNPSDDGVYVPDMTELRTPLLVPENAILMGDRQLATEANMRTFCRQRQLFLAAHPWTPTAQALWRETAARLAAGEREWRPVDYTPRREANKPAEQRAAYRVVEGVRPLADPEDGQEYPLRYPFVGSSRKELRDQTQRERVSAAGEAALQRIARLLGKYADKRRAWIELQIEKALRSAKASDYFTATLLGREEEQHGELRWERRAEAIAAAAVFDGISLLVSNLSAERLAPEGLLPKYKEQIDAEQTIDFIKSPVAIRPMWLQNPQRLAGLTLLIMIAVLVAGLLEPSVRRWIARTGCLVNGLMPEGRDNAYPTAKKRLRAFADYALVVMRDATGAEEVHYPKLRPVQQQIWEIMKLPPLLA
jgi:transposase